MGDFWQTYLVTALVGTLAIHFGAPHLRPHLAGPGPSGAPAAFSRAPAEAVARPSPAVLRRPAARPAGGADRPAPRPADAVGAPGALPPPAVPALVVAPGFTPSTQTVPPSGEGVTHWGVTLHRAPFYATDGSRRDEELPGGTLVEQVGASSSSKGEMAVCRVLRPHGWVGPYLIATADLLRFPGTRAEVDAEGVRALQRYHDLNGQLEARIKSLQRAAVDANPHAAAYREAYADYQQAQARARQLTAERDAASGAARARLADELRRLQNAEPQLRQHFDAVDRQYKAWKQRHGGPAGAPAENDPTVRTLRGEMASLQPRLEEFGVR